MKVYVELENKGTAPNKFATKVKKAYRTMRREVYDAKICKCKTLIDVDSKVEIEFNEVTNFNDLVLIVRGALEQFGLSNNLIIIRKEYPDESLKDGCVIDFSNYSNNISMEDDYIFSEIRRAYSYSSDNTLVKYNQWNQLESLYFKKNVRLLEVLRYFRLLNIDCDFNCSIYLFDWCQNYNLTYKISIEKSKSIYNIEIFDEKKNQILSYEGDNIFLLPMLAYEKLKIRQ